jgi:hypothetical protein
MDEKALHLSAFQVRSSKRWAETMRELCGDLACIADWREERRHLVPLG